MHNDNRALKESIKQFKEKLCQEFNQKANISSLTRKLSVFIDTILLNLFNKNKLDAGEDFCLLALGSYGRRELHLHSDIDLLLIHTDTVTKNHLIQAQNFIQDCWDVGLEVSHQITNVQACAQLAAQELSVISSIMDMYLICGHGALMEELIYQTRPIHMWPSHEYFFAKQQELKSRYAKYGETAYNIEPNIKYGPGGLRDLQTLLSISKRHFNVKKLADGINYGFIKDKEYEELIYCQHFLWKVRFALHLKAGKTEERLSLDYQVQLANFFGYQDRPDSLAIEQFMKDYFKVIKRNRELNEMLLQWFDETIVHHQRQKLIPLDNEFQLSNNHIEVRYSNVFSQHPEVLLTLFLWIVKHPHVEGVRASTIRLIRESLYLLNVELGNSAKVTDTFLELLKNGNDPYPALQMMNRYGVLAHYLDCFALITGQMQYDLFHVYTVDQHTLFVIRNISRFTQQKYAQQFSLCARVIEVIEKKYVLYLSALFHDIAKGRGGDHSELGAQEAQVFAKRHNMDTTDTELLVWLVKNHLLMSQTAQRQDIYDPKTIEQLCQLLPQPHYLDYLYLLTVADICGTNPALWNAWKDSLLKELYSATKAAFNKEQKLLMDEHALINERKRQALGLLVERGIPTDKLDSLWDNFKGKYFLHESPEVIARHSQAILACNQFPLVIIMPHHSQGSTEVFIYMQHRDERFAITTAVLSNYHVTIQEAMISTCSNEFDLDTYIILDEHNQAFLSEQISNDMQLALCHALSSEKLPIISRKRLPRAMAHFKVKTQINYTKDQINNHTRLFLVTNDRFGLLATISRVFLRMNIHLHNAKIATVGERVEDTFYISNAWGQMLNAEEKKLLKEELFKALFNCQ